MIESYFNFKKMYPENVNGRFYVLNEIAKFNNKKFYGFFFRFMGTEKNDYCREFALRTLQKWDVTVKLPKKKKGKKSIYDKTIPQLPHSPSEVIGMMNVMQMERNKSYNVFISHRSTDSDIVVQLKNQFNRQGLSVYVDWMIDKDGLPLEKFHKENTWKVILTRLLNCDSLVYVHSKNSLGNKNIEKEINFAKEHHIPIAVLNIQNIDETNDLMMLPHMLMKNDKYHILLKQKEIPFIEWLNN